MKRVLAKLAVIVFVICIVSSVNAGSVPSLVNYQGKLTDANGNALTDTKTIECSIYDATDGGTVVWGPQVFTSVSVVNGMFNVILGNDSNGKSISDAFSSDARYLSIKVGGVEIVPRQQILSTPFALQAAKADYATNGVPIGTVIASMLNPTQFAIANGDPVSFNPVQSRWSLADGTTDISGSKYAQIMLKNIPPDLRGIFLRGIDDRTTGNQDADGVRAVGNIQTDTFQGHGHVHETAGDNIWNPNGTFYGLNGSNSYRSGRILEPAECNFGTPRVGNETRPKNIAVYYYVKIN